VLAIAGGRKGGIGDITDEFVTLTKPRLPNRTPKPWPVYRELQQIQDETSRALRGVFAKHRKFVSVR